MLIKKLKALFTQVKRQSLVIQIAALIALVSLSIFLLLQEYQEQRARILDSYSESLESKVQSSVGVYRTFSHYVFKQIANNPKVKAIMAKASRSDGPERDQAREKLYQLLKRNYGLLKAHHFRQFHFHFQNGDSFLRMHKPDKYGDNLFAFRESVRLANTEQRIVEGFEEGRIFNGYRFVYPMAEDGQHIGTVEVSLSMASIIGLLFELYPKDDFHFIIKKSVVDTKLFENMKAHYLSSSLSDLYYYDKAIFDQHLNQVKYKTLINNVDIVKQGLAPLINKNQTFSRSITLNGQTYVLGFLSIKNLNHEHVAYFISSSKAPRIDKLDKNYTLYFLFIVGLCILYLWNLYSNHRHNQVLDKVSKTDYLTQLFNRNKFTENLLCEYARCQGLRSTFSLILFDVDHFKSINDDLGHNVGDDYLKELSQLVSQRIRHTDTLARWGGEEFIILLPNTPEINGVKVAEAIRQDVQSHHFSAGRPITISLGVAEFTQDDDTIDHIIARADEALYVSKKRGRNKTTSWSTMKSTPHHSKGAPL